MRTPQLLLTFSPFMYSPGGPLASMLSRAGLGLQATGPAMARGTGTSIGTPVGRAGGCNPMAMALPLGMSGARKSHRA
jgi:hypothetical protein